MATQPFLETDTSNGRLQAHGQEVAFDHSEIFINERQAITHRYYQRPMEPAVAIVLEGNWRLTKQACGLKSMWG